MFLVIEMRKVYLGKQDTFNFETHLEKIGVPTVNVKVFDRDYLFVIDSGCTDCAMDIEVFSDIIKEHNLRPVHAGLVSYGANNHAIISDTYLVPMQVLGCYSKEGPLMSIDFSETRAKFRENGVEISGLIGSNFLKAAKANINYFNNTLTLNF